MIILHMTWTPCWFLSVVTEHAVATGHETQSPSSFMLHPATVFSAGGCITFGCMISDSALRLRYSLRDIIIVPCGCETESLRLPLLNGLESDLLARQLTETKFTARRNTEERSGFIVSGHQGSVQGRNGCLLGAKCANLCL